MWKWRWGIEKHKQVKTAGEMQRQVAAQTVSYISFPYSESQPPFKVKQLHHS